MGTEEGFTHQEVGSLLEVGTNGEDLVDQILHADDTVLSQAVLDDGVVGESNALLVDLSVSALVDELTNSLEVGVSVSDPWFDNLQHLKGGLGHANEDTIVDLEEAEELEDLAGLWRDLVDTGWMSVEHCRQVLQLTYPLIRTTKTNFGSAGM